MMYIKLVKEMKEIRELDYYSIKLKQKYANKWTKWSSGTYLPYLYTVCVTKANLVILGGLRRHRGSKK